MKAKKKPIEEKSPADLGVDVTPRFKVLKVTEPPKRGGGVKVASVGRTAGQAEGSGGAAMTSLVIAEHDNAIAEGRHPQDGDGRRRPCRRRCMCWWRARIARRSPMPPPRSPAWKKCCWPTPRFTPGMLAEPMEALILSVADGYDAILAPATTSGKNFLPRVAAKLDVPQISEIIEVVVARHLRAPDLCRQRHRDGAGAGGQEDHHRAHHRLQGGR